MKIRPVGAEFHADGRADMTMLIVAFLSFANAPKNLSSTMLTMCIDCLPVLLQVAVKDYLPKGH
jgi:hypothetical protein